MGSTRFRENRIFSVEDTIQSRFDICAGFPRSSTGLCIHRQTGKRRQPSWKKMGRDRQFVQHKMSMFLYELPNRTSMAVCQRNKKGWATILCCIIHAVIEPQVQLGHCRLQRNCSSLYFIAILASYQPATKMSWWMRRSPDCDRLSLITKHNGNLVRKCLTTASLLQHRSPLRSSPPWSDPPTVLRSWIKATVSESSTFLASVDRILRKSSINNFRSSRRL